MFGVCAALFSFGTFAAEKKLAQGQSQAATAEEWSRATTIVDGAALYENPSFDSPILDYLGEGKPVLVSKKPVRGQGGLGLFYRVKASGKNVFITDTDIKVEKAQDSTLSASDEPTPKKKKKKKKRYDDESDEEASPYFTRYMGGAIGSVRFSEKFQGNILSSNMPIYGFRMTGPGTLIDGPPIDLNFLFSFQAPDYYSTFTSNKVTGFLLFGDIMPMFPLYEWENAYLYLGLGLMWTYTKFTVKIKDNVFDSQEFRVGADFGLGYGHRIGSYIIRADIKYYYERTQYPGMFLSFQTEF